VEGLNQNSQKGSLIIDGYKSAQYWLLSAIPHRSPPVFYSVVRFGRPRAPQELESFFPFIYASEIFTNAIMTTSAVLRHYP